MVLFALLIAQEYSQKGKMPKYSVLGVAFTKGCFWPNSVIS